MARQASLFEGRVALTLPQLAYNDMGAATRLAPEQPTFNRVRELEVHGSGGLEGYETLTMPHGRRVLRLTRASCPARGRLSVGVPVGPGVNPANALGTRVKAEEVRIKDI